MMTLLEQFRGEAIHRGLLDPALSIGLETAFELVREMPYMRASSRQPQTIIHEWCGTCSGKHHLLKALFAELGYAADLMACTTVIRPMRQELPQILHDILRRSDGRFVDVHNYLLLKLPDGDMIVDATWPKAAAAFGMVVNEVFKLGESQQIAAHPIEIWVVPENVDPSMFKQQLLETHFSPQELSVREDYICALSQLFHT